MRQLAFILVLMVLHINTSFAKSDTLKKGEFALLVNSNQNITLEANEARVSDIVDRIYEKLGIKVTLYGENMDKFASISIENKPITLVLEKILNHNYIFTFSGQRLVGAGVFQKGAQDSPDFSLKEFSGAVMVYDNMAKVFYSPTNKSSEGIAQYISERHLLLDYLAENYPNKKINAQLSLTEFISLDELMKIIKENPSLEVETINPGWKDSVGGFDIDKTKPLDEQLTRLRGLEVNTASELRSIAQEAINREDQSLPDIENIRQMNKAALKDSQDRLTTLNEKGVMIYGLKINGNAKDLRDLKTSQKNIRLMDATWGGEVVDSLKAEKPIKEIAIPISPYINPVSSLEKLGENQ